MKLLTFYEENIPHLGVKTNEGVVDIKAALDQFPAKDVATDIMSLIRRGDEGRITLQNYIANLPMKEADSGTFLLKEEELIFAPAVTAPSKIICVGLNYRKHADETKAPHPEIPILFNKFPNALTAHRAEVVVPRSTKRLDYEVELGIVIGKRGKYIKEADALDYVFGYCTTNDLSARDIQKRISQWMTGKSNDGFAPVGPYVVTKDEIANPNNLQLTTKMNGDLRQSSNTSDMIFSCETLISYISEHMTLEPGDLIMTGTPEGVIIGLPKEDRVYIQPGDVVTVEVEQLGALTNTFIADSFS